MTAFLGDAFAFVLNLSIVDAMFLFIVTLGRILTEIIQTRETRHTSPSRIEIELATAAARAPR